MFYFFKRYIKVKEQVETWEIQTLSTQATASTVILK